MELKEYLTNFKEFSPESIEEFDSVFGREEFPKGARLMEPGNWSTTVYFFEKGLARLFYLKDGKDITHYFFTENSFSGSIDTIFFNRPTLYGMELLEHSIIRYCSFRDLEQYISNLKAEKFIRSLLLDALEIFSDRLQAIQFQSAQERYTRMLEKYPNIFMRAPLGHIASYLGITQETLSRIRAMK